ncbi:MAG: TolC family protein [Bacteroidota bacterium]
MNKIIITLIISIVAFCPAQAQAQEVLSANDAISIALKNSYSILVAANDAAINRKNNTAGNAGMLPTVAINASDIIALKAVDQTYSNNTVPGSTKERSNSFNANIGLNWTLFDGGKMFVTKQKLEEIESLGETTSLELRQAQENYQESLTRLLNFEYSLKISETMLKQLLAETNVVL